MTQRGRQTTFEQRLEIGERWQAGQTDPEIATAMRLSIWTVRKWRRKYQRHQRAGLVSPMGRPAQGALGQFGAKIQQAVRQMREGHPGWGALTIQTELAADRQWAGQRLPSRARLAAFLHQEGYTRPYDRHSELPQPQLSVADHAHQQWEVDAQGVMKVAEVGSVSIINISDLFSRLKVASLACLNTAHPNTLDYQLILRRAFVTYGLPEQLSFDHDSVFYDNGSASPYPTSLHLWLIALGIEVRFIQQPPPAEHSVIERTHQTVTRQAVTGQAVADAAALQQNLTDRLDFLNRRLPCRSLGGQPPLVACPQAHHSGRSYRLEWEEELLDLQRLYPYLAQGRWFRRVSIQGQFSLGAHRYRVGQRLAHQTLEITFDPAAGDLKCLSEDGQQELRLPLQGLTKAALMGELSPLVALPAYQLALPFSQSTWRQIILANGLTGTTL